MNITELLSLKEALELKALDSHRLRIFLRQRSQKSPSLKKSLFTEFNLSSSHWERWQKRAQSQPSWVNSPAQIKGENQRFLQYLRQSEIFTPSRLQSLVHSFRQALSKKPHLRFFDYLRAQKILSLSQISALGASREARMKCPNCSLSLSMKNYLPWRSYPCLFCQEALQGPSHETRSAQETNHPEEKAPTQNSEVRGKIGRYEIRGKLGEGGMGAVYKAFDPEMNRMVAIKVISSHKKKNEDFIRRFTREVKIAANLRHPNILPIYDFGRSEDKHYYTMEYIEGENLRTYTEKKGWLEEAEALDLAGKVAGALEFAHQKDIIHRDVKPENILIDSEGDPYLMDFGLAKELTADSLNLTKTGAIVGSPEFMAPEQAYGEKDLGPGVDLYGVGGVLYFMLAGRPPFQGQEVMELLMKVTKEDPPPLFEHRSGLSREVEVLVGKCLEKKNKDRYPNIALLGQDLQALQKGEPIWAQPPSAFRRFKKGLSRHPLVVAAILAVFMAFTIYFALDFWRERQRIEERNLKMAHLEKKVSQKWSQIPNLKSWRKKYNSSRNAYGKVSPEVQRKQREKLGLLMEIRGLLDRLRLIAPQSEETVEKLIEIEAKIGHWALLSENYTLARFSFERCKNLGRVELGKRGLEKLEKKKRAQIEEDLAKVEKIWESLNKEHPSRAELVAAQVKIRQMRGEHIVRRLLSYLAKSSYSPRVLWCIQVLGELGDTTTTYRGKDVVETLIEKLKSVDVKTNPERAFSIIKALCLLRDPRGRRPIFKARRQAGEGSVFWHQTKTLVKVSFESREGRQQGREEGREDSFSQAWIMYNQERYKEALEMAQNLLEKNPQRSKLFNLRGLIWHKLGKNQKAIEDCTKAIELSPERAEWYNNRGKFYLEEKKYQKARADLEKAISLKPKFGDAYVSLGVVMTHLKEYRRALELYKKALKVSPGSHLAHLSLGRIYEKFNKYKLAIHHYEEYCKSSSKVYKGFNNLGNVYRAKGRLEDGLVYFNRAISANRRYDKAYSNRAMLYRQMGEYQQALKDMKRAIKLNPKEARYFSNRAMIYREMKKYPSALEDMNKAISLQPERASFYTLRALIYRDLNKTSQALRDYNRALEVNSRDPQVYLRRGNFFLSQRKFQKALQDYNKAISLNRDYASAYQNRAQLYHRALRNPKRAFQDYNKAISLNPQMVSAYINRGVLFLNYKKYSRALADFNRAIKLKPDSSFAWRNRGSALLGLKREKEALQSFQKTRSLLPEGSKRRERVTFFIQKLKEKIK